MDAANVHLVISKHMSKFLTVSFRKDFDRCLVVLEDDQFDLSLKDKFEQIQGRDSFAEEALGKGHYLRLG